MGVERALVCRKCKQFIDLHKSYAFDAVCYRTTPPSGAVGDYDNNGTQGDYFLRGGYWESRGLWFLWKHKEHTGVEFIYDANDSYWEDTAKLEEVYSHDDDLKLRETKSKP